jgi:hypothetical protein
MKELKWFVGRWLLMRKGTKKPPPFLQRKDPEEIYDTRGEAFGLQEVVHERM